MTPQNKDNIKSTLYGMKAPMTREKAGGGWPNFLISLA